MDLGMGSDDASSTSNHTEDAMQFTGIRTGICGIDKEVSSDVVTDKDTTQLSDAVSSSSDQAENVGRFTEDGSFNWITDQEVSSTVTDEIIKPPLSEFISTTSDRIVDVKRFQDTIMVDISTLGEDFRTWGLFQNAITSSEVISAVPDHTESSRELDEGTAETSPADEEISPVDAVHRSTELGENGIMPSEVTSEIPDYIEHCREFQEVTAETSPIEEDVSPENEEIVPIDEDISPMDKDSRNLVLHESAITAREAISVASDLTENFRQLEEISAETSPVLQETSIPVSTKCAKPKNGMKRKPTHPPTSQMVLETMRVLKKRKGVSSQAIRNHISNNYEVSMKKIAPHLNRFLRKGVENGDLEQVSGRGAIGRFKIKKMAVVKESNPDLAMKTYSRRSVKQITVGHGKN